MDDKQPRREEASLGRVGVFGGGPAEQLRSRIDPILDVVDAALEARRVKVGPGAPAEEESAFGGATRAGEESAQSADGMEIGWQRVAEGLEEAHEVLADALSRLSGVDGR